jgi:hypothetical protein
MSSDPSLMSISAQMAEVLGTSEPLTERVVTAALADPLYAHHLLACKGNETFLRILLDNPPDVNAEPFRGNVELIAKASKALFHWARTGFSTVDIATFEKRIDACRACSELVAPSDQIVYRAMQRTSTEEDHRICRACGCVAVKKARLPSENCPLPNTENPAVSRWGEPL